MTSAAVIGFSQCSTSRVDVREPPGRKSQNSSVPVPAPLEQPNEVHVEGPCRWTNPPRFSKVLIHQIPYCVSIPRWVSTVWAHSVTLISLPPSARTFARTPYPPCFAIRCRSKTYLNTKSWGAESTLNASSKALINFPYTLVWYRLNYLLNVTQVDGVFEGITALAYLTQCRLMPSLLTF